MKYKIITATLFGLVAFGHTQNCQMPQSSDWKITTLSSDIEGGVAFGLTPKGDAFIAEMTTGHIKYYSASAGTTTDLGKVNDSLYIDNGGTVENGLLGVTPDPNYETNHWIYALYSKKMSNTTTTDCRQANIYEHKHFLVRFTVTAGKLSAQKILLSFKRGSTSHAAGGMVFSKSGDLYISTGDDTNPFCQNGIYGPRGSQGPCSNRPITEVTGTDAQATAGNTNDLRGKLLRIKPIAFADGQSPAEGVGSTYTIPVGNLFDEAADVGNKTRPEIYTMGHRNPYRFRIDPVTGWVLIGEVGPDADQYRGTETRGVDEINLVKKPGNFGWPFFNANNRAYQVQDTGEGDYVVGSHFDSLNLKNKSKRNTGLVDLPNPISPIGWYNAGGDQEGAINKLFGSGPETAIGGPRSWYSESGVAARMPAYFQGKFIVGDWSRNALYVLDVDENGKLRNVQSLDVSNRPGTIIDLDIGPDGVLYALFNSGGNGFGGANLARIEYKGTHYPASVCGNSIVTTSIQKQVLSHTALEQKAFSISGNESALNLPQGVNEINLYNTQGKVVWHSKVADDATTFSIPNQFKNQGLVFVKYGF